MAGYLRSLLETALRPVSALHPVAGIRHVPDTEPGLGDDATVAVPPDATTTGPHPAPRVYARAESAIAPHVPATPPRPRRRGKQDERGTAEAATPRAPESVVAGQAERVTGHRPRVASRRRPMATPSADFVDMPASRPPIRIGDAPAPAPVPPVSVSPGPAERTDGHPVRETARLFPASEPVRPSRAPVGPRDPPARSEHADTGPVEVHIHIGRIELVSPPRVATPRQQVSPASRPMSLDAYLKTRSGKPE